MMRTMHLTASDAEEVRHKLGVLGETQDLMDDYGVTEDEIDALIASAKEGAWQVPDVYWHVVAGEMGDHVDVLHRIAEDARNNMQPGQAGAITRQANRLDRTFTD